MDIHEYFPRWQSMTVTLYVHHEKQYKVVYSVDILTKPITLTLSHLLGAIDGRFRLKKKLNGTK
ncbi:hypothetical protein DKT75_00760 [Leucothrix arctica]|uniref:Uncharacterized protein n=1 Tax=Leucothrix arctica TaxID=1481894 RepID=A0A317CM72_9GAMM|nr:hypothetical protein DKT75_00760 [Leucothrix arctica]